MTTMTRIATAAPPRNEIGAETKTAATAEAVGSATRRRTVFVAAVALFVVAAVLRVGLIPRTSLWADELFSLAMATGHSLEHKAETADAAKGDYIETHDAV